MSELRVENIRYRYKKGDRIVLNGLSCTFEGGRMTAVVGPSGSGKSALLSILAGLDRPMEGRVLLNGQDLAARNLDGENSRNVVALLSALAHQEGYCVVIVTHDLAVAKASDVVYEMEDGVLKTG